VTSDPPRPWYEDFFSELPNEFWRRAVPPEATLAEVDFAERRLDLGPPARVLDVPCGGGRHTIELARRGHRVTGVDLSTEAIAHARAAAAEAGVEVELLREEMRALPRTGAFDAAICMGNSVGYLDEAGLRDFLAALAAAVRPGGGLVLDYGAAAESVLPGYTGEDRPMRAGDISVEASTEYDVAASRLLSTYRFARGSERLTATAVHHVYTVGHLGALLADAGFGDVGRYGDPDGTPYGVGSRRLLLTARRA
jgi:SAM-dependent methyltransferase